jgi:hypothetical protein
MINSQNHTTIYIPVGPMGVPVVGNLNLGQSGASATGNQSKSDSR